MATLPHILKDWETKLETRARDRRDALAEAVRQSGGVTAAALEDLAAIEDCGALVARVGRAMRLGDRTLSACDAAARAIAGMRRAGGRWALRLWRHGGGHVAYLLAALLEPIVLLSRFVTAVVCSRAWVEAVCHLRRFSRVAALRLSNALFHAIVYASVTPMAVAAIRWFHRRIWPGLARAAALLRVSLSIVSLLARSLAARGELLTAIRVTLALARRRRDLNGADPEPELRARVARAMLGHDIDRTPVGGDGAELWVDVSPAGPLFGAEEVVGVMELWQRIDSSPGLDRETWEQVLGTFDYPVEQVVAAVDRIARPPRPLLSAVLVATGLRMGIGHRLARLRNPHLRREASRWKFFARAAGRRTVPRRYVIVTPLNSYEHQKRRILAGKLTARILEAALGREDDGSSFRIAFVLPACRPGSDQAADRRKLTALVREALAGIYLPPAFTATIIDDLGTDLALPNLRGLHVILALRRLCRDCHPDNVIGISEVNDSASWLNIPLLAEALPPASPSLVTGRRPAIGAGKPVAGHAATRLFNCIYRSLVPTVTARDSSSVLKVATVASLRTIANDLTCLDYSIDQDILAMMALRGRVVETPIEWYQARGKWGHERPAAAQIASLFDLARKSRSKRRLSRLRPGEWLPLDAGFDFQAWTNDAGVVLKGHAPERNRLVLLLCALRSIAAGCAPEEEGHRRFERLVPLATSLIRIFGQGPLKAVLRLAEGRYRDPLPAVLEHLKYRVPVIVETELVWRPRVETPAGASTPFLFALRQPLAILGTLRTAMDWNLRFGDTAAAADTLRAILALEVRLVDYGMVDPDLKSLLDCGVFLDEHGVVLRHLDFAGFLRDPRAVDAVLPGLSWKIRSMRDFRQLARSLGKTPEGRARVARFLSDLDAHIRAIPQRLAAAAPPEFAPVPAPAPPPDAVGDLGDMILATAKFATHAPIGPRALQLAMRRSVGYGAGRLCEAPAPGARLLGRPAGSSLVPVFITRGDDEADAIRCAMAEHMPSRRYELAVSRTADAMPLTRLLAATPASRVVMRLAGHSSRMRHLLAERYPHKALMPVFGRPLFVHAIESVEALAAQYPGRVWYTHPDTLCLWGSDARPNPDGEVVVPLAPDALRVFAAYRNGNGAGHSRFREAGKLFARCFLAARCGGYSLPSLIGLDVAAARDLREGFEPFGDAGEADFWAYWWTAASLGSRRALGSLACPTPQTWFDLDEPLQLMSLYRHSALPGFMEYFGVRPRPAPPGSHDCVNIASAVDTGGAGQRICLRGCIFDNSTVSIELDPRLAEATVEGLVVANSNLRIRIAAPAVRDSLVYGVTTARHEAVALSLDGQAIGAPSGRACAVPLALQAFCRDGSNEVLRCPCTTTTRVSRGGGPWVR